MLTTSTQIHLPARAYSGQADALARLMDLMYQFLSEQECDALAEQWDTDDPNAVIL